MNYAAISAALLAGITVVHVLIPGLHLLYRGGDSQRSFGAARLTRFVPALVLGSLLLYGVATALTRNPDLRGEGSFLLL